MASSLRKNVVFWIILLIILLAAIAGIITVSILYSEKSRSPYNYGIVIDAGSSHTDLYIYRWSTDKANGTGIVEQIYGCPSSGAQKLPPLSDFLQNPEEAGDKCVKPCLENALGVIPGTDYATTPVFLGATAGMRILGLRDNASAEAIMSSVRNTISKFPFSFSQPQQQARIITGKDEGAYGWVTSNYLSGSFGVKSNHSWTDQTVGALDMGGASTQITFDPAGTEAIIEDYRAWFELYGRGYNVYTHSYLCYGMDEANRKFKALLVQQQNFSVNINDPCAPAGNETQLPFSSVFQEPCSPFPQSRNKIGPDDLENMTFVFSGTSDPESCQNLTQLIFDFRAQCPHPPCTFDGVYQPPLFGQFYAFSGFYYVARDIGLDMSKPFSLNDYRMAMNSFCNKTWQEISGMPKPGSILVLLCFQAQYVHHILVDAYGFNVTNWNSIKFVSKINGNDFGWTLGMMVNTTNVIPSHVYVRLLNEDVFIAVIVVLSVILLCVLVVAVFLLFSHKYRYSTSR